MLATSSVLLTVVTIGLVVAALLQYRTTKEQTDAIRGQLTTMQEQTNTMQRQLSTFNDQANSMREQTGTLRESLEETRKAVKASQTQADVSLVQANTSRISAKAAEKAVDVAQLGTRAYVSVDHMRLLNPLEANKPIVMLFEFVNDGNSPAEISGYGTYYIDRQLRDCTYSNQLAFNRIVVAPKSPRSQQIVISRTGIGQDAVDALTGCTEAGKCEWYIQLCIKTTYSTVGGRFPFENCSYYFNGLNTFLECPKQ